MILEFFKKLKWFGSRKSAAADPFEVVEIKDLSRFTLGELRRKIAGGDGSGAGANDPFSPVHFDMFEQDSVHLLCRHAKTKEPLAYARLTPAAIVRRFRDWAEEYHLDAFPEKELNRIAVLSKVIVLAEHRKKLPAVKIAVKLYETALERMNAWAAVTLSDFGDYNFNRWLGYRPMARISPSKFGGYRLPLFLILHDYRRLKGSESPLCAAAQAKGFPRCEDGLRWMESFYQKEGRIETGFMTFNPELTKRYEPPVMRGLTPKGREEFMAKSAYLKCARDEVVLRQGSGGAEIGFVMQGALEVCHENKVLAVLSGGDMFGEIAAVLGTPRSADVAAAVPNTEILLVPISAVEGLKEAPDRSVFWKNLSEILLGRLSATCRLTEGLDEREMLKRTAEECGVESAGAENDAAGPATFLASFAQATQGKGAKENAAFWRKLCEVLARRLTDASRLAGSAGTTR